ncbi:MAG: shikimate kinase [Acidimicrobiia bacterium]
MSIHVALVGSMGTGKTTVGRLLAGMLGRSYLDNDDRLVELTRAGPAELTARDGLASLHALEATLLLEALAGVPPAVVAGAASVVDDAACRAALHTRAFTVWLVAPPEVVARRTQATGRPRQSEDLARLAARRAKHYQEVSRMRVDTSAHPAREAAALIAAAVRDATGAP